MRCYTASARRYESVEYEFKRGSSGQFELLKGANFGWSGSALKHSESQLQQVFDLHSRQFLITRASRCRVTNYGHWK